jgi:hypothetical protein
VPAMSSCFMLPPITRRAALYICHSAWDAWRAVRHIHRTLHIFFTRV